MTHRLTAAARSLSQGRVLSRSATQRRTDATRRAAMCGLGLEVLETRRFFCAAHAALNLAEPTELRPDLAARRLAGGKVPQVNEPADIVWTNRGTKVSAAGGGTDGDGFFARFGTSAATARAVVDAIILSYERMIGSFNYPTAGTTYSLSLSMSSAGSGFGASAGLSQSVGGLPKTGSINMGAGSNDADPNNDNGWFLDPTPNESSEFLGNLTNGFALDATGGGPASGRGDFYTVVAAEMTHCMGLFGNSLPGWAARTSNTGIADTSEAGGAGNTTGAKGNFWVFQGPSIKHLMTGNNGGPGGNNTSSAIHVAGPDVPVNFGGDTYLGAQEQGNAVYEFSRRYLVNNAFSLMFKDAYGYSSVNPARWQSAYSVLNETSKLVTVRGGDFTAGSNASNDAISITRSGNTISVSVDVGQDVAGTGAFAGAGDQPAFVTEYDISQISSISISGGGGDDTITIASDLGVPVSINAGSGIDTVTFTGTSGADAFTLSGTGASAASTTLTLSGGVENLVLDGLATADTFNVPAAGGFGNLTLNGGDGDDVFTLTSAAGVPVTVNGGNNDDTVTIAMGFGSAATFNAGAGSDALAIDATDGIDGINVGSTSTSVGGNPTSYAALESLTLNARNGADTITVDGTGFSSMAVVLNGGAGNDNVTLNNLSAGSNLTYNASTGTDTVTVASTSTWDVNSDLGAGAQIVNVTSPGTTRFNVSQHLNTLDLTSSGRASLAANGARLLNAKSLVIAANAQLDLFDNDMVVATTNASARGTIEGYVKKGYNFGGNDGVGGVISSTAANNPNGNTALGFMSGDDFNNNNGGAFGGQSVGTNDSVIKYTYFGDVDFNGAVDASDYNLIDFGFSNHLTGWANGDADYSGGVDASDYNLIDFAFATQLGIL